MLSRLSIFARIVAKSTLEATTKSLSTAPPKASGQATGKKRFRLPVETDVNKLMTHCCGANYTVKNGEEIKLRDDSEYPEWLWELPLKPLKLHQRDPNTKDYWEMAMEVGKQREGYLRKLSGKPSLIVDKKLIKNKELKYLRRFRALAKYHYDPGYEVYEHTQRDDIWNLHKKDTFFLPDENKPFYPGVDQVKAPSRIERALNYTKKRHFYNKKF